MTQRYSEGLAERARARIASVLPFDAGAAP